MPLNSYIYTMRKEVWSICKGFNNYEASNLGRIRFIGDSTFKRKHLRKLPEMHEIIKPIITDGGRYYSVRVYVNDFSAKKTMKLHRLVFFAFNNCIEIHGHEIDHKNSNRFDCQLDNLQYISHSQNISKSFDKSKTTSKYTGVHFRNDTKKWSSMIRFKNKRYVIGSTFLNQEDAANAYSIAYRNLHEYGCIDVP